MYIYKKRTDDLVDVYLLPIKNWYNSSPVFCYRLESRLRHIKVRPWRIAPPAIITRESVIRWAEVGSGDGNRCALEAPLGHLGCVTHHLIAATTCLAIVEQSRAQRCSLYSITIAVKIAITTCTT